LLFLPYQADQIAALRSIISTWMRLAISQTLSLGEGDHRLWFAVVELDALGPIDGLSDALPRLRKFGGALRARVPVDLAGEHDVWPGACAVDGGELRQHGGATLFGVGERGAPRGLPRGSSGSAR
jgi:hypothetical protein